MIEDFRLRVFTTVTECGSFTEAARALGVSQPAVSQNISQLEAAIGEPLLERAHGSVAPTAAGMRVLSYARRILDLYSHMDAELVQKTEAPAVPMLLKIDENRQAEISVEDGEIHIRL